MAPPHAVLFDYDGTLVDTEPYWMRAEIDQLARLGVPWTLEDARQLCGTTRQYSLDVQFAQMAAHGVETEHIDRDEFYEETCRRVIEQVVAGEVPWLPGARELLEDLHAHGVPCAVVSASPRDVLEAGLGRFPAGSIQVVVDGEMVPAGKPDPTGYLMAAERLGVAIDDCIVVEDTASGTAAGRAAGAVVLAVPGQVPLPEADGQIAVPGLTGLNLARLQELFARARAA